MKIENFKNGVNASFLDMHSCPCFRGKMFNFGAKIELKIGDLTKN